MKTKNLRNIPGPRQPNYYRMLWLRVIEQLIQDANDPQCMIKGASRQNMIDKARYMIFVPNTYFTGICKAAGVGEWLVRYAADHYVKPPYNRQDLNNCQEEKIENAV